MLYVTWKGNEEIEDFKKQLNLSVFLLGSMNSIESWKNVREQGV